jgi:hypothetical protein
VPPLGLARGTNDDLVTKTTVRPRIGRVGDQTMRRGRGFSGRPHLGGPDHTGELIGRGRFSGGPDMKKPDDGGAPGLLGPIGGTSDEEGFPSLPKS